MKSPPDILATGDLVSISADGEAFLEGQVRLAAPNGVSLVVSFDGVIYGHAMLIPLMYEDDEYRLLSHRRCVVKLKRRHRMLN